MGPWEGQWWSGFSPVLGMESSILDKGNRNTLPSFASKDLRFTEIAKVTAGVHSLLAEHQVGTTNTKATHTQTELLRAETKQETRRTLAMPVTYCRDSREVVYLIFADLNLKVETVLPGEF